MKIMRDIGALLLISTRFACLLPASVIYCNRAVRKSNQSPSDRGEAALRGRLRARPCARASWRPLGDAGAAGACLRASPLFRTQGRPAGDQRQRPDAEADGA